MIANKTETESGTIQCFHTGCGSQQDLVELTLVKISSKFEVKKVVSSLTFNAICSFSASWMVCKFRKKTVCFKHSFWTMEDEHTSGRPEKVFFQLHFGVRLSPFKRLCKVFPWYQISFRFADQNLRKIVFLFISATEIFEWKYQIRRLQRIWACGGESLLVGSLQGVVVIQDNF